MRFQDHTQSHIAAFGAPILSEPGDKLRRRLRFYAAWIAANLIGCAVGWTLAEAIGHEITPGLTWSTRLALASISFELAVWGCRGVVLYFFKDLAPARVVDYIILLSSEAIGWVLNEANYEVNGQVQASFGTVFAQLIVGTIWLMFWLVRLPRLGKHGRFLWAAQASLAALVGMMVGVGLTTFGLVWSMDAGTWIGEVIAAPAGWAFSGAILGACIGAITGLALLGRALSRR